jgi:hypothetical protein
MQQRGNGNALFREAFALQCCGPFVEAVNENPTRMAKTGSKVLPQYATSAIRNGMPSARRGKGYKEVARQANGSVVTAAERGKRNHRGLLIRTTLKRK